MPAGRTEPAAPDNHQPARHMRIEGGKMGQRHAPEGEAAQIGRQVVRAENILQPARQSPGNAFMIRRLRQGRLPMPRQVGDDRSEEHTSELQSLMRLSYAVFSLK